MYRRKGHYGRGIITTEEFERGLIAPDLVVSIQLEGPNWPFEYYLTDTLGERHIFGRAVVDTYEETEEMISV